MKKIIFKTLFLLFAVTNLYAQPDIILAGLPGTGKGTLSQYLKYQHQYVQICPGDIFREEIDKQTQFGQEIAAIVANGDYVDDEKAFNFLKNRIVAAKQQGLSVILDGYPRSKGALELLQQRLLNDEDLFSEGILIVVLEVPDEEVLLKRISNRITCPSCKQVYNSDTNPSKQQGICDYCGTFLTKRKQDTYDILMKRFKYYHENLVPLISQCESIYPSLHLDATQIELDNLAPIAEKIVCQEWNKQPLAKEPIYFSYRL
ncbi:MAG: adenylate kinase family protein [Chlamydiota bacterium]